MKCLNVNWHFFSLGGGGEVGGWTVTALTKAGWGEGEAGRFVGGGAWEGRTMGGADGDGTGRLEQSAGHR